MVQRLLAVINKLNKIHKYFGFFHVVACVSMNPLWATCPAQKPESICQLALIIYRPLMVRNFNVCYCSFNEIVLNIIQ